MARVQLIADRDIFSNFVSGAIVVVDPQFRVGDRIEMPDPYRQLTGMVGTWEPPAPRPTPPGKQ